MDSNDRDYDEPQASTVLYDPVDSSEYEFVSQLRKNIIMVAYYRHSIFFVHGLNGHPFHSWKHKNSCVWPRDLLPRADGFGSSRIISLAYNSKIVGSGATTQSLFDHARGMLADVRGFRHEVTGRPILFVAHGIGGNILKEMLIASFHEDVPQGQNIARNTKAIVFLATPQRGATIMNELYTTLQILRFLGLSTARRLVKQFRPGTDYLYEASIRFNEVLKAVPMQIFSFYASLPIQVLFLKKNSPSWNDVLIGNPLEQCLPLEGSSRDIQKMSGSHDPNFERVLGLIRPLMQSRSLPRALPSRRASAKRAPNTKASDLELKPTTTLELGLYRVVITEWSCDTAREMVEVPVAALLDRTSQTNFVSKAFVAEMLPGADIGRYVTLTFRPSKGEATQSRHFEVVDYLPHPMILAGGGAYSGRGHPESTEGNAYEETGSTSSPAAAGHLPMITQSADSQQIVPRVTPTIPNEKPVASPLRASETVSVPALLPNLGLQAQGGPISSPQATAKAPGSGILASSGELARTVTSAAESQASSAWGPSTGIAMAALGTSTFAAGNSIYGTKVARGARAQAVRSADIAQQNLDLNKRVFKYNKRKDAAAGANVGGRSRPPHSDSDSDDVDSAAGGSSSKSTSLRAGQARSNVPSAAPSRRAQASSRGAAQFPVDDLELSKSSTLSPPTFPPRAFSNPQNRERPHDSNLPAPQTTQAFAIMFPRVPTHAFDDRPPEGRSPQVMGGLDMEMDEFPRLRENEGQSNAAATDALPVIPVHHGHDAESSVTGGRVISDVDDAYRASVPQQTQGATLSSDGSELVREREPELTLDSEGLVQQSDDQPRAMASPATVEEPEQGPESTDRTATQAGTEGQDEQGILTHQESTGDDLEPVHSAKAQLLTQTLDEYTIVGSAKKERQDLEVENGKVENVQERKTNLEEDDVDGNRAKDRKMKESGNETTDSVEKQAGEKEDEDEQVDDICVEADSRDGEGSKIKAEAEAGSQGILSDLVRRVRTF